MKLTKDEREFLEDELLRAENSLAIELDCEPGSHEACFRLTTTIKALKQALAQPAAQEWRPRSDAPPDRSLGNFLMGYSPKTGMEITMAPLSERYTHFMPLPQPPKP